MRRRVWVIARQELRGFYDQPTAYVLAVAFLALSLFLLFRSMYATSVASLRPLFELLPIILSVFVPAATMRSLAEERRGKTLEWLMAQPVTEGEVVAGKFLGAWLFVLMTFAGTLPTAVGVLAVSEADPGIMVAQYLGAALLAAQLCALGLWASSFSRNQITAFIVSASAGFTLYLIGLPVVQIGLPPSLSGALARLSLVSHFENVARGVVDLRDVLYFASTAALFLALAWGAVARERLSPSGADLRRLKAGVALAAVLVVALNLLGGHVRGRLDLTRGNLFTLAPGTREILSGLPDVVQVKLFASSELPPELQLQLRDVRDLLSDMSRAADGNLVVSEQDPGDDEKVGEEARAFGVEAVEFNVLRENEFQIRRGYYGLAVLYADDHKVIPVIERTDDLEFRLAAAIESMTREQRPRVEFVQGFGARGPYSIPGLEQALADRFVLETVDLSGEAPVAPALDSAKVLVVAAPAQPVSDTALSRIRSFVAGGGSALVLIEPAELDPRAPFAQPVSSGLEPWLRDLGMVFSDSLVYDLASSERVSLGRTGIFNVVAPYPLWPIARPAMDHPLTRGLSSLTLSWAGSLQITDSTRVRPLWQTTEQAGAQPSGGYVAPDQNWTGSAHRLGVRTVAAAYEPPEGAGEGRVVVVADGSFVDGRFAQAAPANVLFIANAIDWLAQDEALMSIRAKDRTPPPLTLTSDLGKNALKWGNLVGLPVLLVLFGVVRISGRRRRAKAVWGEVVA